MATTIDLLRHGEPEGGPMYRGSLDDPLSELGWRQMQAAVEGHPAWEVIYTSPLRRCALFADGLGQQMGVPVLREPRLQEMHFGTWEGRTSVSILETEPERLIAFWRDPLNHPPPEGEHLSAFRQRVEAAWQDMLAQNRERTLLLVAHSGVIRMLLGLVLQVPLQNLSRMVVEYASVSRIRVDEVGGEPLPRLLFHGGRF
ncbi:MAG: alpha-ribazole phosphatase family protein [Magnetococcus sp. YQC-3]